MGTPAERGWGPGWPTSRSADQVKVSRGGGTPVATWVHRGIAPLVVEGLRRTEDGGYDVRLLGGYNSRPIRGSTTTPSNHSWGLAVDINPDKNPMTSRLITDMPKWMVDAWKDLGFGWGGDWRSRPDAMHYEYMGTPTQAAARIRALGGTPPPAPVIVPPGVCSEAHPVLREGAEGRAVSHLQHFLIKSGAPIAPDGRFGGRTKQAVRNHQQWIKDHKDSSLGVDGVVGPHSWQAFHNVLDGLKVR